MTEEKIKTVCRPGNGESTCRYLAFCYGFQCMKLKPGWKEMLDKRVADETIVARGDNCEGEQ
jgi:hypothetical protein